MKKGSKKSVQVVTGQDITVMLPKNSKVVATLKEVVPTSDPLVAPLKQGDNVGKATYVYKDPVTQQDKTVTIDVVATEDVDKAGWFKLMLRAIGAFFSGLFKGIVNLF